jgi:hypothetical protein
MGGLGRGFFCRDIDFCQCPCNSEEHGSGLDAICFGSKQLAGDSAGITQNCARSLDSPDDGFWEANEGGKAGWVGDLLFHQWFLALMSMGETVFVGWRLVASG